MRSSGDELNADALIPLNVLATFLLRFLLFALTLFRWLLVKASRFELFENSLANEFALQHAHRFFKIMANDDFDHDVKASKTLVFLNSCRFLWADFTEKDSS